MGFIVSLKGLNSALGIVFSKGESGCYGNHRMTTHRPWDREKEQPKKDRNKAENKNLDKIRLSPKFISFRCCCLYVCEKQARWLPVGLDEDPRRWGCVCEGCLWSCWLFFCAQLSHQCISVSNAFLLIFSSLMTMFNANKHHWLQGVLWRVSKSASAFIHATHVGSVMF